MKTHFRRFILLNNSVFIFGGGQIQTLAMNVYHEGVLTLEQAKARLEKLYANKSLGEEIYREFMSKIQSNS